MTIQRSSAILTVLTLALGAMAFAPATALAEKAKQKPRVAVKQLEATRVPREVADVMTGQLCTALSNQGADVLCAADLAALLEHAAVQQELAACEGDDCLSALAKAAKADYVVKGSLGKLDETYVLNVQLIDARTSKVRVRASERTEQKVGDLLDKLPALAKKLKP